MAITNDNCTNGKVYYTLINKEKTNTQPTKIIIYFKLTSNFKVFKSHNQV